MATPQTQGGFSQLLQGLPGGTDPLLQELNRVMGSNPEMGIPAGGPAVAWRPSGELTEEEAAEAIKKKILEHARKGEHDKANRLLKRYGPEGEYILDEDAFFDLQEQIRKINAAAAAEAKIEEDNRAEKQGKMAYQQRQAAEAAKTAQGVSQGYPPGSVGFSQMLGAGPSREAQNQGDILARLKAILG